MIEARDFVEAARRHGFKRYAGVPCSYLTPFINYVAQDPSLEYLSMANEGDAVALMAGVALSGDASRAARGIAMMQNSGLGNAVSPLTSLTWTFCLPQLLIVTWRGQPGVADEPQHELMGAITPAMLESMQIAWELFPSEASLIEAALERALKHMDATKRPFAFLMQKGSVKAYPLCGEAGTIKGPRPGASTAVASHYRASVRPTRRETLQQVIAHTSVDSTALFASTGFCGRELYALDDRANHFYMVGSMGCVTTLAMGFALERPDVRVIALDGDGAALMRLGAMATIGAYGPANLHHLLLDNGVHDSTGGQATVSAATDFGRIALACGYASAIETDQLDQLAGWLEAAPAAGPRFLRVLTKPGSPDDLPRPSVSPVHVRSRFMQHFCSEETT